LIEKREKNLIEKYMGKMIGKFYREKLGKGKMN